MAILVKVLAEGQLPNTKTTLYTVPGGTKGYIKFLSAVHVSGGTQVVEFFVNISGTSRKISYTTLLTNESVRVIEKDEVLVLDAGDFIEGRTTDATSVDYVITGAEEA